MAWCGTDHTTLCDTDHHDKTEILLKETLNNITLTLQFPIPDLILKLYTFNIFYLSYFPYRGQKCQFHAIFNQNDIYYSQILYKI